MAFFVFLPDPQGQRSLRPISGSVFTFEFELLEAVSV